MKKTLIPCLALVLVCLAGSAGAYTFDSTGDQFSVNYSFSDGKSPWAFFTVNFDTNVLTIQLEELGVPAAGNADVLTALFFCSTITFTPLAADTTNGDWIGTPLTAIGQEWDYDTTLAPGVGFGANQGIGSVGDAGFDQGNFALPGSNVNGVSYGLVNGGFGGTQTPVFDGVVTFGLEFSRAVNSFDIDCVSFNYSSGIDQRVPLPPTVLLLGSGLAGLGLLRRRS